MKVLISFKIKATPALNKKLTILTSDLLEEIHFSKKWHKILKNISTIKNCQKGVTKNLRWEILRLQISDQGSKDKEMKLMIVIFKICCPWNRSTKIKKGTTRSWLMSFLNHMQAMIIPTQPRKLRKTHLQTNQPWSLKIKQDLKLEKQATMLSGPLLRANNIMIK